MAVASACMLLCVLVATPSFVLFVPDFEVLHPSISGEAAAATESRRKAAAAGIRNETCQWKLLFATVPVKGRIANHYH